MMRQSMHYGAIVAILALLMLGCGGGGGGGDGGGSFGAYVATFYIGGDCGSAETRGADVEVFGRNVIFYFYTPADFMDCVSGYSWSWDGNMDTGMEQFVAGPCLFGLSVDFPPQDVLPPENRAYSSCRANPDGSYTIYEGSGAIENSEGTGYVCQGALSVEIRPR